MNGPCCPKPIGRIIKVGNSEAGLVGLGEMFKEVLESELTDEQLIRKKLVDLARQHGNYISQSLENQYEEALLQEYRLFCARTNRL